jgi:predicted histidine transporter YuiF (NhaC family)
MLPELQPILAAVLSVVALIVLVTRLRVYPFLGLLVASLMLGFLAGLVPADIIKNFGKGFGDVMGSVGIIIGLGTMLGGRPGHIGRSRSPGDQCTKSVTGVVALLRILAGCTKRKGRIPAVVFDR